jgi:hypothetical protein
VRFIVRKSQYVLGISCEKRGAPNIIP